MRTQLGPFALKDTKVDELLTSIRHLIDKDPDYFRVGKELQKILPNFANTTFVNHPHTNAFTL